MDKPSTNGPAERFFAFLVTLYPRKHRARFGDEMVQVFSEQCREVARSDHRFARWITLWARTLADWFVSILREHLTDPNRTTGLLEAPVYAPLPWKGVLLVLLPGLVFFISQIGQLTGTDWFYLLMYRGAYFMILPVLAVWIWKRRFPVWGLLPLGLLYQTIATAIYRHQYLYIGSYPQDIANFLVRIQSQTEWFQNGYQIVMITGFILVTILLLVWVKRQVGFSRQARIWTLLFFVVWLINFFSLNWDFFLSLLPGGEQVLPPESITPHFMSIIVYTLYDSCSFLIPVLFGGLLSKQYGRLALLLPMGSLLTSTIYGRISNDWPVIGSPEFALILAVAVAALLYRFTVAIAGPLWVVRSASPKTRQRAGGVSLLALIAIQAGFSLWWYIYNGWSYINNIYITISDQMIFVSGIFLALALYREIPAASLSNQPVETVPEQIT
jgi:hypothetical protein